VAGLVLLVLTGFLIRNLGLKNLKTGAVLIASLLLIVSAVLLSIHPWQGSLKWDVTLVGTDGKPQILSYDKIKHLPSYTGKGGFFTTVGVVYGPYEAKGVPLRDLCQLAGGITQDDIMMISASDGYSTVFDYDQVMGNFITYDVKTMKEVSHRELKAILTYQLNGNPLSDDDGKPLRIAIVGSDGLLTEGNSWVKWVTKIEILKIQSLAK